MKKNLLIVFLALSATMFSQKHYNLKKGVIAKGYDVVSYFSNKAVEGSKKYATEHEGVKYLFSSQENLKTFQEDPAKYVPQYGGWCAYALGAKGKKVSIDPETFEIRDGKLYLFYNSWGTNTFEPWSKDPENLRDKADKNWKKITKA